MNFIRGSAVALMFVAGAIAHPLSERGSLLSKLGISDWAHPSDHPVNRLFVRQSNSSTTIGSAAWVAQYPKGNPDGTAMPAAWLQVLNDAVAANKIPDIPLSNKGTYSGGVKGTDPEVCSSTAQCQGEGDIWDAPDGILGLSFDDGPTDVAPTLYDFLRKNNQRVTHFMIGENIRDNYQSFQVAFKDGNDMAVHTWSHQYMTGLSNEDAFAQLAWTMQIISDLTGGRVPRYWRPPFGDSDNRIRAIAKLLGLVQVNWNHDTNDWELQTKKTTLATIKKDMDKWLTGPKSPGLIILEHELDNQTVKAFIDNYPTMVSNGWDIRTIPQMAGTSYYLNSADNTAEVVPMSVGAPAPGNVPAASSAATDGGASSTASGAQSSPSTSTSNNSTNSASSLLGVSRSFMVGLVASVLFAQRLFS